MLFIRTKIKHFQLVLWEGEISAQPFTSQQKDKSVILSNARLSCGAERITGQLCGQRVAYEVK